MRPAVVTLALVVLINPLVLCAKNNERPIGTAVFIAKSDGTLQPVYPVRLTVTLESNGKIVQHAGSLSCEVRARVTKAGDVVVTQTVLRCDDGNTYVVTGQIFQGDKR